MLSHSEGIWNAEVAVCIAEEVMRIEEADFYRDFDLAEDFPPFNLPVRVDTSLPPLPGSHRLRQVNVMLPNNRFENIIIECQRDKQHHSQDSLIREYDVGSKRWRSTSTVPTLQKDQAVHASASDLVASKLFLGPFP
jgi:hypothetical protein